MIAWSFAVPVWWPWLLVLPVCVGIAWRRVRGRAERANALLGPRERRLAGGRRTTVARFLVASLAAAALALAWLRPVGDERVGEAAGPEFVIALDVSWSMAAQDVRPARLSRAVADLLDLADNAPGARGGLVAFAGQARLLVPLTGDLTALHQRAERLEPGAELAGGTDLGAAIDAGVAALQRAGSAHGSVVVLTDGEDFAGTGRAAAERAQAAGIVVHCLGYGTEIGSKIAVDDGAGSQSYLQDSAGVDVISALDPATLELLAEAGGGTFALAGGDANALTDLYAGALVPRARTADLRTAAAEGQLVQRFQWPLLLAVVLWMLRLLMPERRR